MILQCLVLHTTSLPHSGLGGITYLDTSSKLNNARVVDSARLTGEWVGRDWDRRGDGDTTPIDILDARELATVVGADATGEEE